MAKVKHAKHFHGFKVLPLNTGRERASSPLINQHKVLSNHPAAFGMAKLLFPV